MKKFYSKRLLSLGLLVAGVMGTSQANAQYSSEIVGPRLIVEAPASISGVKQFTYSSNPAMTGPWGAPLGVYEHKLVVRPTGDSLACSAVSSNVAGNWVLIYRGNCEFGFKALNAQQAGAEGVIIWNHTPNQLINMGAGTSGAGVTIPVVFVSHEDGMAMAGRMAAGEDVYISMTNWGFNKTHDLALLQTSPAPSPGLAVPFHQLDDGGDVPLYRGYTGATVANTGASTETNVKIISSVTYTPTGGATSPYKIDTAEIATFAPGDSIWIAYSSDFYNFSQTQKGRYDFHYSVVADDVDEYSLDNTAGFSFDVTSGAFCRGKYDVANNKPVVTGYSRLGSTTTNWTWGPMFYNRVGGFTMESIQLALTDQDTAQHSLQASAGGTFIDASVFKWVDANSDGYATGDEMDLVGTAVRNFAVADSPRTMLSLPIGEPGTGNPMVIVSQSNSRYWVAVNLGTQFNVGVYDNTNYYVRHMAGANTATPVKDYANPGVMKAIQNILPTDTVRLISYGVTTANSPIMDSADYLQQDAVPAVALVMSELPTAVAPIPTVSNELSVYPNPANSVANVKINLAKTADKVFIKIMDAMGRQISMQEVNNVKEQVVAIPVNNLAAGTYYAVMIHGERALARKFVVGAK